jgi:predicted O-methyltransferase YrrM
VPALNGFLRQGPAARFLLVALGLAPGRSPHTQAERDCLARYAANAETVVELGVEQGTATALMRRGMSPSGRLYAVDPHPAGRLGVSFPRLIARRECSHAGEAHVEWLRMTEAEAASIVAGLEPHGVQLVFSDCVFDYESLDAEWRRWRSLVAAGGIFIQSTSRVQAPRTNEQHDTVRFARDVLLHDPDFDCVEAVDTFTILVRRS